MYNTGERKKNYKNKRKTTFGPPLLPTKHTHKIPPLTNLKGGDPLDPCMEYQYVFALDYIGLVLVKRKEEESGYIFLVVGCIRGGKEN